MSYFLVISCVFCAWAMLRVVGDERTQMVKEVERQVRRVAKTALPAPAGPPIAASPPPAKSIPAPLKAEN
jgi:hypothetical protein